MADQVETTPTTTVEETTPAVVEETPAATEAAPATNGDSNGTTEEPAKEATNGDAAPEAEAKETEATNGEAKEAEVPAANGDAAPEAEAVKRKADDSETDATTEKIAKLKEVAAEKVAESLPAEPANEEEAKKPEEVAA